MDCRVVAIVPAFDAEAMVGGVVHELAASFGAGAVVVVDDGSVDRTGDVARAEGVSVVRHTTNRGKGAALRTGFVEARRLGATHAVTVDADGQHPAAEAWRLACHRAPLENLVLGVRDLERAGAPSANRTSNAISNFFLSWFSGRTLRDTQCGLRRYPIDRTLSLGSTDDGYAFEADVVLRAARAGWGITEVDISVYYPPEDQRVTHFDSVRDPARIVWRVVSTLAETGRTRAP